MRSLKYFKIYKFFKKIILIKNCKKSNLSFFGQIYQKFQIINKMKKVPYNQTDIFKQRTLDQNSLLIGVLFDETIPCTEAETETLVTEKTCINVQKLFQKENIKLYPISIKDFWKLSNLCPQLDGLVMMGGRDIHPAEYGEEIQGSITHPESRLIYSFFKTVLDNL